MVAAHHEQLTSSESYENTIADFDRKFSDNLLDLLHHIFRVSIDSCEHKLMNIIYLLDFNGYYKSALETRVEKQPFSGASARAGGGGDSAAPPAGPGVSFADPRLAAGGPPQPLPRSTVGASGGHHHPTGSVIGPVSVKPTSKDIPEEMNNDHEH